MKNIILSLVLMISVLSGSQIYATFNVQAQQSANLAFYSSGVVKNIYVDISSEIKKGDKLIELQNSDLKASLNIAKSSLENAKVSLKFATKDYKRQLLIKDLIDEERFDKYELNYEQAKVAVKKAKANLAYKQSLLDRTYIYAPFDGVIFEKSVEIGDVVSGMMLRTIFRIQSKNKRKLILEFDQKYWKTVKLGDSFKYTINGDDKIYYGKISKIYPYANSGNRKIKAEVKAKDFVVGLFGDGYIQVPDKK
jgi:RND family efflux transporter MFP subunit